MIKKFLIALTIIALLASLAACGAPASNTGDDTQTNAPASGNTESTDATDATDATEPDNTHAQVTFEETVIVDNESCTFTITAIEDDNLFGYTLKAYLENKTDLELMFALQDVSVNGFMCDPFWASTVTAGMKANEDIIFLNNEFEANGITDVTDIEFTLRIYDSNDLLADTIVEDTFTIYPMGEDAVQPYVREAQEGEVVLFDNEYCTMIVTGYDPDNLFGYAMNVYLENKTDKALMFSSSDVSVNGFMCDPFWATSVAPGKRCNTSITWMETSLADNGITEVESIVLPVRVYDSSDWMADDLVNETFTVNP